MYSRVFELPFCSLRFSLGQVVASKVECVSAETFCREKPGEAHPVPTKGGIGKGPSEQHYCRRLGRAEAMHHQLDAVSYANAY